MRTNSKYLVIFAVLCTSASSIFIRMTVMPPLVIAFYRMAISAVFLAYPFFRERGAVRKMQASDVYLCAISGVALALHFGTWIASLSLTSVAASTVLVSLSPIFVALINAAIFRKKPGNALLFSLLIATLGTVIISAGAFDGSLGSLSGNVLALCGAVCMAVYLMLGQEVRKRVSTAVYAFMVFGFAAAALFAGTLAFSQPIWPYPAREFVLVGAMALVCSIGGHTLYNMLLKYHGATLVSLATLAEPVFASILAVVILSEIPRAMTVAGGVLAVTGVFVYIRSVRTSPY